MDPSHPRIAIAFHMDSHPAPCLEGEGVYLRPASPPSRPPARTFSVACSPLQATLLLHLRPGRRRPSPTPSNPAAGIRPNRTHQSESEAPPFQRDHSRETPPEFLGPPSFRVSGRRLPSPLPPPLRAMLMANDCMRTEEIQTERTGFYAPPPFSVDHQPHLEV